MNPSAAWIKDVLLPDGVRAIHLTRGKYTIVDEVYFEFLSQWNWYCTLQGYAQRTKCSDETGRIRQIGIRMHRLIMKAPKDMQVDHINGDRLDNRRCNLRICTNAQNLRNQKTRTGRKYKGIIRTKCNEKWEARIRVNGKTLYLGKYLKAEEAACAYNAAAIKYFGEFARLNKFTQGSDI